MASSHKQDRKHLVTDDADEPSEPAEEIHDLPPKHGKKGSRGEGKESEKRKRSCPLNFGVKSYLHNFYESHAFKDPLVYEDDDDFRYLLHSNPKRRRCPPIWWKIFLWVGVNLLLFGVIGILVGYLVPPKNHLEKIDEDNDIAYVDRNAEAYNTTLDMCKLIGLILFCVGGMTLALSLLFPSFFSQYCEDDPRDEAIKVPLRDGEKPPLSPIEMSVPVSAKLKGVQPTRKSPEAHMTKTGTIPVK
ncbi:neurensin-1 [Patella vulgata]|uniref:neurensin-1 n=1 Tax=Patella vulgata TaxID=6465 RepID=UPI0021805B05|nr:neurensin-1 [Patella vulgata]